MAVHDLKTWPKFFAEVLEGRKTFELRRDDRGFKVGDTLNLQEWNPETGAFTGCSTRRRVTYLVRDVPEFGLKPGFVIMSLG